MTTPRSAISTRGTWWTIAGGPSNPIGFEYIRLGDGPTVVRLTIGRHPDAVGYMSATIAVYGAAIPSTARDSTPVRFYLLTDERPPIGSWEESDPPPEALYGRLL